MIEFLCPECKGTSLQVKGFGKVAKCHDCEKAWAPELQQTMDYLHIVILIEERCYEKG